MTTVSHQHRGHSSAESDQDGSDTEPDEGEIFATDCVEDEAIEFVRDNQLDNDAFQLDDLAGDLEYWSKTKLKRHGCTAHALQLVVKECLKKNPKA
ncbi:unnamed protein product, partial [Allacma fusca]